MVYCSNTFSRKSKVYLIFLLAIFFQIFCSNSFAQKIYSLKDILQLHNLLGTKKEQVNETYKLNPMVNYDLSDIINRTYIFKSFNFLNTKSRELKPVYFNTDTNSVISAILICTNNTNATAINNFLVKEYGKKFSKVELNDGMRALQWSLNNYCILSFKDSSRFFLVIFNCKIDSFFRYPNLLKIQ